MKTGSDTTLPHSLPTDTICAVATAPGGALGLIRVSGPQALAATEAIFRPARHNAATGHNTTDKSSSKPSAHTLTAQKAYTLAFGQLVQGDDIIDEVLVSVFRAPHSYTGEDATEISCHGSDYILQKVLQLLVGRGCRLARPGEFTERAFLHGKMDLSQAEAVADLIASSSAAMHRVAMQQMRGGFSNDLKRLREKLLNMVSLLELELDFADHEDLEFADRSQLKALAEEIAQAIARLADSFRLGNALKSGVPVAIIGQTNAGKSTLLNALLHEDRAIVSDIPGTTRDSIEDTVNVQGITFRFIDTAGLRHTDDRIELLGIGRSLDKIDQASIVLWLLDATDGQGQLQTLAPQILPRCQGKTLVLLYNKTDLCSAGFTLPEPPAGVPADTLSLAISAKEGWHIDELQQLLVQAAHLPQVSQSEVIVTNLRHYEALCQGLTAIRRVLQGMDDGLSGDFLAQDLRECLYYLGLITGDITTDEVLGNIFKNFCIGK